jgi:hypothetical protein
MEEVIKGYLGGQVVHCHQRGIDKAVKVVTLYGENILEMNYIGEIMRDGREILYPFLSSVEPLFVPVT